MRAIHPTTKVTGILAFLMNHDCIICLSVFSYKSYHKAALTSFLQMLFRVPMLILWGQLSFQNMTF